MEDIGDLDKLYCLEELDLSGNQISEQFVIDRIGTLPILEKLVLKGNPIAASGKYRIHTFMSFGTRHTEVSNLRVFSVKISYFFF